MAEPSSQVLQAMYRHDRDEAEQIARDRILDVLEASALGHVDHLEALLGADATLVAWRSADGFTPLHYAAFFGGAAAVQVLIDHEADVAAVSDNAMHVQPLHSAAAAKDAAAVGVLLAAGAPVNARQTGGWTPLHEAAQEGDTAMVDMLLAHGADPSLGNDDGRRPFELAEAAGHADLAERLRV